MNENVFNNLEQFNIDSFQTDLVSWFSREKRDLPWRRVKDPYKIWVSEIMLQQTRVDTVIPYFERFMEQYPSIESFAEADEESILKIWEGLGYYSRVRNLHSAVKEVVEHYDGIVPDTPEEIIKLKGVGPYTAGAVLSIAYGRPEPAVDGNVMRVLSRILLIWEDIAKTSTRKVFEQAVRAFIDIENPSYFNQALMELGALICTPTSPSCLLCPVRDHCLAFANGAQTELPVKTRKNSTRHEDMVAAVLKNENNEFLIRKRPETGLLANLWEFPNVERKTLYQDKTTFIDYLGKELKTNIQLENGQFFKVNHAFTHLTWTVDCFAGSFCYSISEQTPYKVVTAKQLEELAFPVSHQKIWRAYKEQYVNIK